MSNRNPASWTAFTDVKLQTSNLPSSQVRVVHLEAVVDPKDWQQQTTQAEAGEGPSGGCTITTAVSSPFIEEANHV